MPAATAAGARLDAPPDPAALPRQAGVVRWFCPDRGFGFVIPDDGTADRFVTFAALPGAGFRALENGQRVTFLPDEDAAGPTATNVEPA